MHAPPAIIRIWDRFSEFPTETLTKAWWYRQCQGAPLQRSVELMKEQRSTYGASGNCFDVAIWLRHEFTSAGIEARMIGRGLCTPKAHIAVIALDERGHEYFCDLGDQWLQPILISEEAPGFSPGFHSGFVPGMRVKVDITGRHLFFTYSRAVGKEFIEQLPLESIPADTLIRASNHSQTLLRRPFAEVRATHPNSRMRELWEYDRGQCRWLLDTGTVVEEGCNDPACTCWTERIHNMTGISLPIIATAFDVYGREGTEM